MRLFIGKQERNSYGFESKAQESPLARLDGITSAVLRNNPLDSKNIDQSVAEIMGAIFGG